MIWQTKKWQEMLKNSKQVEKTISFEFEGKNIFIERRKISLGETGLFILGFDISIFNEKLEKKLVKICKEEKSLFIQIETFSYKEDINIDSKIFKKGYFKNFITPYTTILDLKKSKDEILAGMKTKGRYNIKLATKKGVEVREMEKNNENIKIFTNLIVETAKRDNFMINSKEEYFKKFVENLDFSKLFFAYYEKKVISAGIFTYDKKIAIYYYGASSSEKKYRNLMAPYLLQWEAIKIGKENGCEIYDFLGIATPGEKNNSLIGVSNFKLKFSQDIKNVSENYIFVNKKLKFFFINLLRKLKKKLKKT